MKVVVAMVTMVQWSRSRSNTARNEGGQMLLCALQNKTIGWLSNVVLDASQRIETEVASRMKHGIVEERIINIRYAL